MASPACLLGTKPTWSFLIRQGKKEFKRLARIFVKIFMSMFRREIGLKGMVPVGFGDHHYIGGEEGRSKGVAIFHRIKHVCQVGGYHISHFPIEKCREATWARSLAHFQFFNT